MTSRLFLIGFASQQIAHLNVDPLTATLVPITAMQQEIPTERF